MPIGMQISHQLKIAHLFQGIGLRFFEPHAVQLHIYHTIRGLQQTGHQVSLLALQGQKVLYTSDLQVFKSTKLLESHFGKLGLSGASSFLLFESGVRRIQTELPLPYLALFDSYRMYDACCQNLRGYDVLHERYNLLALGGALASRKLGIPLVLEVNADLIEQRKFKGTPEKGVRHLFALWSTRFCFDSAAKIICVSAELKDHLHSKWNVDKRKLEVLSCAADIEAFRQKHNSELTRQRLGLTTEPVIMWIGGFYDWHDLDLMLESLYRILQQRPDARLVMVGDGESRPRIEQKAVESGLQHALITTGAVSHSKVPELLSIADVTVAPSAPVSASHGGTGTPLKLFEYMAAGKAIVATSLNHATAVIQNGHNGLLVEPGNADALTEAIVSVLNDPSERDRLGQNARQEAVEKYSWEQYSSKLKEIYLSI